jgi:hypothetical protein
VVTVLVLVWLHIEGQSVARISAHAWYTFWYVVPTLPMFLLLLSLLNRLNFGGLHVTMTQVEPMVEPHWILNDFGWESVTFVNFD